MRKYIFVSLVVVTLAAQAAVVERVGLEWLSWDETEGMSVDQALLANPGWRRATVDETLSLINSFDFGYTFTGVNTTEYFFTPAGSTDDASSQLIELMGATYATSNGWGDPKESTSAWFGFNTTSGLGETTDRAYAITVIDEYIQPFTSGALPAEVRLTGSNLDPNTIVADRGVALVRLAAVPEPASVALISGVFAFSVICLRRLKRV
ncbi:MAG: hypothetical protein ACPGN3_00595 [Opitutales bacterium]